MTPVFVAPCGWDGLSPTQQAAIQRMDTARAIWVAPIASEPVGWARMQPLLASRPLELWAHWLSEVSDPVLVAVHPSAEPLVLSRRHRTALIDTSSAPVCEQTVAIGLRADWVVVPASHPLTRVVPAERIVVVDAEAEPVKLPEVNRQVDRFSYHRLLTAELFNRFETARHELKGVAGLTTYRRVRLQQRLIKDADTFPAIIPLCRKEEDKRGLRLAAYVEGAAVDSTSWERDGFVETLLELGQAPTIASVTSHPSVEDPNVHPLIARIALTQALRLAQVTNGNAASSGVLRLLTRLEDASDLSPNQILALGRLNGAESVIAEAALDGPQFTAIAARYELARRDFEAERAVDADEIRADIATIDTQAWHSPLWHAGLAYWERLSGLPWTPSNFTVDPPAPTTIPTGISPDDIAALDAEARVAHADGDFGAAIKRFDRLRAECLAVAGAQTTEIAARLNLAAAHHAAGAPATTWQPLVESAINDVRPPLDLAQLRERLNKLAKDIETVNKIDALANHVSLFRSGTRYWRRATGTSWAGGVFIAGPVAGGLPGPIEIHERVARWLLRLQQWRLAASLYRHIRAEALACQPPRTTVEWAARINQGWALSRAGVEALRWQPLIGSALTEVGPPEPLMALRTQLLERKDGR